MNRSEETDRLREEERAEFSNLIRDGFALKSVFDSLRCDSADLVTSAAIVMKQHESLAKISKQAANERIALTADFNALKSERASFESEREAFEKERQLYKIECAALENQRKAFESERAAFMAERAILETLKQGPVQVDLDITQPQDSSENFFQRGYYEPWSEKCQIFAEHQFCKLKKLQDFVLDTNRGDFTATSAFFSVNHKRAAESCLELHEDITFGKQARFPIDDYYVDLSGPLSQYITQIIHFEEPKDVPEDVPEAKRPCIDVSMPIDDSKDPFDIAFNKLQRAAFNTDEDELLKSGIYNQSSFETQFNLKWISV